MDPEEKRKFYGSMLFPGLLILTLWLIKLIEVGFQTSFSDYGLLPQSFTGLRGILFSPFLHADWKHLSANSVPLFLLSAGLFYYYGKKARIIFILCWLVTGLWVWIFARDTGTHIGASGVVYALATFHFTSGILRREPRMMAFSLLVVFLYGGLIWGVIPDFFPEKNISWESHLLGGLAGIVVAFSFRGEGPQRTIYQWDEEDEDEDEDEDEGYDDMEQNIDDGSSVEENKVNIDEEATEEKTIMPIKLNYIFTENKKK